MKAVDGPYPLKGALRLTPVAPSTGAAEPVAAADETTRRRDAWEGPLLFVLVAGIVVVESVFGWPGIGQLAWQAIQRVDIPIIMGVTIVSACAIILGNLLADIVAPFIDPRIKLR